MFSGGWTVEHRSKEKYLWFFFVPWKEVVGTMLGWASQEWQSLSSLSLHFLCRPLSASSHLLCPGCTDSMTVDVPWHSMCKVLKHTQGRHPVCPSTWDGWSLPRKWGMAERPTLGCKHHWHEILSDNYISCHTALISINFSSDPGEVLCATYHPVCCPLLVIMWPLRIC